MKFAVGALHLAKLDNRLAGAHHPLDHPEDAAAIQHFFGAAWRVAGDMHQLEPGLAPGLLPLAQAGKRFRTDGEFFQMHGHAGDAIPVRSSKDLLNQI